jgi:hypothetical protein
MSSKKLLLALLSCWLYSCSPEGETPPESSAGKTTADSDTGRLLEILRDSGEDPADRVAAAESLGRVEGESTEIDRVLIETIRDSGAPREVREAALRAHGKRKGVEISPSSVEKPRWNIQIEIPTGPPDESPLLSGAYVLSTRILLTDGTVHQDRRKCTVTVDGESIAWITEGQEVYPVRGTLKKGLLQATCKEPAGEFELRGKVVRPGKLVGTLTLKPAGETPLEVRDGRWSLERLPGAGEK